MRGLAVEHLVEDDSHGPDVTLGRVGAAVEDFWAHVHGTAHQRLVDLVQLRALLVVLGEPEICDLVGLILDEDVGGLEVAMDDGVLVQVLVPSDELLDDDNCLGLGQFFPLLQHILKRALVAQLLEEVDVVGGFLDIVEFYDVVILDGLHDLDLILERLVKLLRVLLDVGGGDGLDGDEVARADIGALVDLAIGTPSDLLVDVDDERLHKLIVGCA